MATKERERLRELVERMPGHLLPTATGILEVLVKVGDPVARALAEAPFDDQPLTEAERQAVDETWDDVRKGETPIAHEEVKRRLGIG